MKDRYAPDSHHPVNKVPSTYFRHLFLIVDTACGNEEHLHVSSYIISLEYSLTYVKIWKMDLKIFVFYACYYSPTNQNNFIIIVRTIYNFHKNIFVYAMHDMLIFFLHPELIKPIKISSEIVQRKVKKNGITISCRVKMLK